MFRKKRKVAHRIYASLSSGMINSIADRTIKLLVLLCVIYFALYLVLEVFHQNIELSAIHFQIGRCSLDSTQVAKQIMTCYLLQRNVSNCKKYTSLKEE